MRLPFQPTFLKDAHRHFKFAQLNVKMSIIKEIAEAEIILEELRKKDKEKQQVSIQNQDSQSPIAGTSHAPPPDSPPSVAEKPRKRKRSTRTGEPKWHYISERNLYKNNFDRYSRSGNLIYYSIKYLMLVLNVTIFVQGTGSYFSRRASYKEYLKRLKVSTRADNFMAFRRYQ